METISKKEFYREKTRDETREDHRLEHQNNRNIRLCRTCHQEIYPVQAEFGIVYPNICKTCGTVQ